MEKPPVDYDLVDKLGALLCATALAQRDPLAQLAALGPAQPTAAALEDYVVELRGRILRGIIEAGTSRVKLAEELGVERSRVQAMLRQADAAQARREAAQQKGASAEA
ncbi:hypothetical protein [Catellatospora coxensis]|uniref:hypothetical protein n=1 Tax=Catellatospora coxensis TaxID=310354 RepID=UPI001945067F|nr:hypothetical protein [Catellatospora coxensis]